MPCTFMCEISTARNNGLISRAKEILGLRCFFFREEPSDGGFVCIKVTPPFALWLIWIRQGKQLSGACATRVLGGHCQCLELLRRARWLNQSGGPAPAPESRESVPPLHILRGPRIAGYARDNCGSFRFRYRGRSGACPSPSSTCGPAST